MLLADAQVHKKKVSRHQSCLYMRWERVENEDWRFVEKIASLVRQVVIDNTCIIEEEGELERAWGPMEKGAAKK